MEKICQKCQTSKNISEYHLDNSRPDGYSYVCKKCRSIHRGAYYEINKQKLRENYNPEQERNKRLRLKYGISENEYQEMYSNQNGKCWICQGTFDKLNVDHCHNTNVVRGLLCSLCNTSLGGFKDSIQNLERAILYLKGE